MSQIITIEDPKDYQEGDLFTGWHSEAEGIVTQLTNVPIVRSGNRLMPAFGAWFLDTIEPRYHDVTVTREIPDPPTLMEQFDALEVGDHFKRADGLFPKHAWVKINDYQSVLLGQPRGRDAIFGNEHWATTIQIEKVPR